MISPMLLLTLLMVGLIIWGTYSTQRYAQAVVDYGVNRGYGWLYGGSLIAGDYLSAATFLGLAGLTFAYGYDGGLYALGFSVGLTLLAISVAGPLRRLGVFSVADFMGERFSSKGTRFWAILSITVISAFYAAAQLLASALILKTFFGAPYPFGVLATVIVMVFYAEIAGAKGTPTTRALEIWLRFGAIAVLVFLAFRLGFRYEQMMDALLDFQDQIMGAGQGWAQPGGTLFPTIPAALSALLAMALGPSGLPHVLEGFYRHPTDRGAKQSVLMAVTLASGFFVFAVFLGVLGRYLFAGGQLEPSIQEGLAKDGVNLLIPFLAQALGGEWVLTLVLATAFSAIFFNLAGIFLASSRAIGQDFYSYFINPYSTEGMKIRANKVGVLIMGVIFAILGLLVEGQSIGHLVVLGFTVAASTLSPVILLSIWWRGTTEKGAVAGMWTGLVASLIAIIGGHWGLLPDALTFSVPGIITVPLGFIAVLAVSLWDGRVPADTNEFMERLHS